MLNYDELRALHGRSARALAAEAARGGIGAGNSQDSEPGASCGARSTSWATGRANYLLEQFVPGDIFHVDSIVSEGKVVFSVVHQYGRPPMQVMHEGGVFTTRTVDRTSGDWKELTALNARLAPSLGMLRGVTHAEYIRAHADGRFYFLEIAARVGGAFIADLVEVVNRREPVAGMGAARSCEPARRSVCAAHDFREVCGQRAVPGQDRRAGHRGIRCAGNCGAA